jgi:polyhydroxybutyrate depolymerase
MRRTIALLLSAMLYLAVTGCQSNPAESKVPATAENNTVLNAQENQPAVEKLGPGDHTLKINWGGYQRAYIVHVPTGYDGNKPAAVIIMLHGGGGTAKAAMLETGWTGKSDGERFLVVFPEALPADPSKPGKFSNNPQTWNDGSGRFISGKLQIDDVGFINAVLDDISARCNVDQRMVFITGFSNGAAMTYRAGLELSHRIASIAPISGHFYIQDPRLSNPVSLLSIFGLNDPLNPAGGGKVVHSLLGDLGYRPPLEDSITRWAGLLGCKGQTSIILDENGVKGFKFSPCDSEGEVVYYTVEGMGHTWPGGKSTLPEPVVGKVTDKINADDVIWQFFKSHPKIR